MSGYCVHANLRGQTGKYTWQTPPLKTVIERLAAAAYCSGLRCSVCSGGGAAADGPGSAWRLAHCLITAEQRLGFACADLKAQVNISCSAEQRAEQQARGVRQRDEGGSGSEGEGLEEEDDEGMLPTSKPLTRKQKQEKEALQKWVQCARCNQWRKVGLHILRGANASVCLVCERGKPVTAVSGA